MTLIGKDKVKRRMVEYIVDSYWIKDKSPQYKDIRDGFSSPPFSLSEGSISNYLEELVEEKKIRKWREGNNVFYAPPKMPPPLKFTIIIAVFCFSLVVLLYIFFNYVALPIISFYIGVLLTCFVWANSKLSSSQSSRKNTGFQRKKHKKEH